MDPLSVGHVIKVGDDELHIAVTRPDLKFEFHGTLYRIGRLGSYVTIPLEEETLVAYVTGTQATPDPNDPESKPRQVTLSAQLLGTIRGEKFVRGVNAYPTLGDPVRLGVDEDFELIFGSFDALAAGGKHPKSFSMGRFAVDTDFEVRVLGKEFFSKHIAVMGNSGSGKSVTTTKILYEALKLPHTQIVMFDMHGEYVSAFSDDNGNPLPNVTYLSDQNLIVPYWMLRYEEMEDIFIDNSNPLNINAQRIFLREALERLKQPAASELQLLAEFTVDTPVYYNIEHMKLYAENMNDARFVLNSDSYAFSRLPQRQLPKDDQEKLLLTRRMAFNKGNAEGEVPHATYYGKLLGFVNQLEMRLNDRRYDFLLKPFEQARRNPEMCGKLDQRRGPGELSGSVAWVIRQLLGKLEQRRNLTIVDLSGLPFDVVDITVAVLTRTLFDFNFWSPPEDRRPFVMVYEEAHNYLPRRDRGTSRMYARQAVEKVAKEGRKYGVSAMIVSQRPSEISETVLSQCNSMVLMRMNNPDDQEYAARVVSDQFRSLISLLPSMKPGEGFIIGDAVMMPMRTLIDLPPRLPRSGDVDYFKMWSTPESQSNVEQIVDRWWRQDRGNNTESCEQANESSQPIAGAEGSSGFQPEPDPPIPPQQDDKAGKHPLEERRMNAAQRLAALAASLGRTNEN
jgi:DNA helicase HerA-like ATPase